MIKKPWEDNEALQTQEYMWIPQYLMDRGIPFSYLKKPSEEKEKQVEHICERLLGSRNFILLTSNKPVYVRELYYILAGVWLMTTSKGFEVINPLDLDFNSFDFSEKVRRLKSVDLLMIPYVDPSDYSLRKIKTAMSDIIGSRKISKKPTLTDLYIKQEATSEKIKDNMPNLASVFGEHSIPMFLERDSNSKIIKIKGK